MDYLVDKPKNHTNESWVSVREFKNIISDCVQGIVDIVTISVDNILKLSSIVKQANFVFLLVSWRSYGDTWFETQDCWRYIFRVAWRAK